MPNKDKTKTSNSGSKIPFSKKGSGNGSKKPPKPDKSDK